MPSQPGAPALDELRRRLPELTIRDERRLRRKLDSARGMRDARRRQERIGSLAADVVAAEQRILRRRASVPAVTYPRALPVSASRDELAEAIRESQVVVVAGETGSGKTTQLPKLCLELGRGIRGSIGHTQPRRLAARTVAQRIADELGVELGEQVGYQVRFTDRVSDGTLVKLMTDGILLAEIQRDRLLASYDTVILDEAHERSLNVDFLLGYLAQLLPRRPDLKLVVTSATIDPERFSRHFGGAPIVEVSGRTYPVEVRYRPLAEPGGRGGEPEPAAGGDRDRIQAICDAVEELSREGPGDILVFLSGERDIRDTTDALRQMELRDTEVAPLYARLSTAEQQRVFQPHQGRRIVLATNVAETSLTVPGIRYVVDPGTARISRYSQRTKVQRLPIEPISKASADQRKGRCGRVEAGICIRLYAEEDFAARPDFTEPEILRTNLAAVVLQMTALGLGDVAAFPFLDPPDRRSVRDAFVLLHELGAIDSDQPGPDPRLTAVGRKLAQLPVDPRLGRMVVEADRNGCLREVLVIAAALSIQDPRERPAEARQAADALHARFADDRSDFLAYLSLWGYLSEQQAALSSNAFRRLCRSEHLHHLRVREWQDLHAQLRSIATDVGMTVNDAPAAPDVIAVSLLAGLLSHIGLRQGETRDYAGARGARFAIWPGSALARKPPTWVVAAELVETSRLWGRTVARIDPAWAERLAPTLVQRTYSEPHWDARRGAAVAFEKVTLYGVVLVASRKVAYGRVDPVVSRELFLRHALVEDQWETSHRFLADNRRLLERLSEVEDRLRRREVAVDEDAALRFYDARVPADVVSTRHFDAWWKQARQSQPDLLTMAPQDLLDGDLPADAGQDHPDEWVCGDRRLRLSYRFEPGTADDGVTVHIPLALLPHVEGCGFDWQVPGLRRELVTALIRSLPKPLRRDLGPAPELVRTVLPRLSPGPEPLTRALARELRAITGVTLPPDAWDVGRIPDRLRVTYQVHAGSRTLAQGKDLVELRRRLAPQAQAAVASVSDDLERRGLRTWDFPGLPRTVTRSLDGHAVQGYPALVDEGDSVGIRVLVSQAQQRRAMWAGTRRMLLLDVPPPAKAVHAALTNESKLVLARNPHGSVAALLQDCTACAIDVLLAAAGGPVWEAADYHRLRDAVAGDVTATVTAVLAAVERVLDAAHAVERRLAGATSRAVAAAAADVRAGLSRLVGPGFVAATGRDRLPDLVRYVRALEHRLDKAARDPARDAALAARVDEVAATALELVSRLPDQDSARARNELGWMIEELRVSVFAQQLGTRGRVSEERILRAAAELSTLPGPG